VDKDRLEASLVSALHGGHGTRKRYLRGVAPAWLGVVPARHSTGGKVKLSGISKHGDPAPRTLPITGARSAVQSAHLRSDPTSQWLTRLRERAVWQTACVATRRRRAKPLKEVRRRCERPNAGTQARSPRRSATPVF
jgi:transposase